MRKKSPALGLILALLVCLSASCSGSAPATASAPLRVEWTLWQGDYTLLVANQMGFFKKYGVNVDPVRFDSSSQALSDLAGARLDGGLFTMSDFLLGSSLADIKAVYVSDDKGQYSIVGSPGIHSVSDLQGKRIGLNLHTSAEMYVSDMLKTAGLTSNDVRYLEMSPDQVIKSSSTQIDAGLVWEPYTTQAIKQGKVVVFQSASESLLIPTLVVFRSSVLNQRPQDIRAFILAWDEAVQYRISHPQESLAIISKATGLTTSDLQATGGISLFTISDNLNLFASIAGSDPNSIYYIAGINRNFLVTAGYLTTAPAITTLLDPSFLK
jgi:NitT/TauT family transport system substrate-binding protein